MNDGPTTSKLEQEHEHEHEDDNTPAGFQIVCCPIQLNRSSSEIPPTQTQTLPFSSSSKIASSKAVDDTPAPVQLSGSRTTSLQRPSSFQRIVNLHREPSRPTTTTPNDDDDDEEQPNINVQRSTLQASRGRGCDGIAIQSSRSVSSAKSQRGSVNEEQSNINVHRSTSLTSRGDGIAIQPSRSGSSASANSQLGSINEEGFVIAASFPYGQEEVLVQEPRQRRQRRPRNKCATVATLCVCLGVCAGLVVLSLSTDSLIQQSLQRHGSPRDYDGDGLSDEIELQLGTDPLNADADGNGKSDGEELVAIAKVAKAPRAPKAPKVKTPKAPKAPKVKTPKAPKAPKVRAPKVKTPKVSPPTTPFPTPDGTDPSRF
eukprot:scaffold3437_cov116-Skeletonema_marinoi.AAC.3